MMSTREQTLFRATLAVVALAAVYFLLVNPALNRWEDLTQRRSRVAERENRVRSMMVRRPEIRDEIHDLEERITSSAPETMEADFHAHLKEIAERSRVTPSSVKMVKRKPLRDDFEEIVLSIGLECDMNCLTDYLVQLEKMSNRLVKISRLDISRSQRRRGSAGELGVNMVLSTVVKSKPEDEGAGEGPEEGGANEGR